MIGPHYGEWWNERPRRSRIRRALPLIPLLLVLVWGGYAGLSGSRPAAGIFDTVGRGDTGAVRTFLASGGSASARHAADGASLLHRAQEHGHRDLAMLLVREGADVNAADRAGVTALHRAAGRGDAEIASQLLREGADPNARSRRHGVPLHWAARAGSVPIARALLDAGAPVDATDSLLRTPLHVAVLNAQGTVAEVLRARGADPDARLPQHRTLLHWAAATGRREVAASIVSLGAGVGARDGKGNTALHYAALRGDAGLAAFLIERGAAVDAPTPELLVTPLHYAAREGHVETVRALLARGADPNARSRYYGTPLHWAADRGQREAAALLIAQGALAATIDDHRLTAGERARRRGHVELATRLAGAAPAVHASPAVHAGDTRVPGRLGAMEVDHPDFGPAASVRDRWTRASMPRSGRWQGPMMRAIPASAAVGRPEAGPAGCALPEHMHRASRAFLDDYLEGDLPVAEFRRLFSLPNSDYLGLGRCLIALHE